MSESTRHSTTNSDGWAGCSFKDACKLAREGWPEGADKINAQSKPIFNRISGMIERFDPYYTDEGSQLDVARYLDNEPECWVRMESVITQGPGLRLIRLVYNIGVSAGIESNVIQVRGSAVATLVECLEYAGHRVQVEIGFPVADRKGGSVAVIVAVRVKDFDQPLDIPRFAYAVIHPSTFRRLGFSIMEQFPYDVRQQLNVGTSYGYPTEYPQDEERGEIYVSEAALWDRQWNTPDRAQQWIIQTLENQGVTLHPERG